MSISDWIEEEHLLDGYLYISMYPFSLCGHYKEAHFQGFTETKTTEDFINSNHACDGCDFCVTFEILVQTHEIDSVFFSKTKE